MSDEPSQGRAQLDDKPWLAGLSEAQRQVASYRSGPQLVTAGPGSGKTRTLCAWIVELIRSAAARPDEILAVTFTRRAAVELHDRLSGLLGAQTDQLLIGTFHRLALRLAPLPPTLRVGDESERLQLIEQASVGSGTRKSPPSLLSLLSLRKGQYPDYRESMNTKMSARRSAPWSFDSVSPRRCWRSVIPTKRSTRSEAVKYVTSEALWTIFPVRCRGFSSKTIAAPRRS